MLASSMVRACVLSSLRDAVSVRFLIEKSSSPPSGIPWRSRSSAATLLPMAVVWSSEST